jgi:two-component system response regulator NreC
MSPVLRLLIIDDQSLVCEGLKMLFETATSYRVVVINNADEAVLAARRERTDVVILDAALPDDQAFDEGHRLAAMQHAPKVIFLDEDVSQLRAHLAFEVPGSSYLVKSEPFGRVVDAVPRVVAGERVFCEAIQARIRDDSSYGLQLVPIDDDDDPLAALTRCELEVLRLLALGHSVRDCADQLKRASSTVDNHRSNIMKKLDLHKIAQLTRFAIHQGLID